jgi:hypothetical protein
MVYVCVCLCVCFVVVFWVYQNTYIHTHSGQERLSRLWRILLTYVHTCIRTYIHTHIHTGQERLSRLWRVLRGPHTGKLSQKQCLCVPCIHTYIHTYIHAYVHIQDKSGSLDYDEFFLRTYIRTYVRTYIHTCIQTHTGQERLSRLRRVLRGPHTGKLSQKQCLCVPYIHTYIHAYVHIQNKSSSLDYDEFFLRTYIRTYIHTYIHTYIQTHTGQERLSRLWRVLWGPHTGKLHFLRRGQ